MEAVSCMLPSQGKPPAHTQFSFNGYTYGKRQAGSSKDGPASVSGIFHPQSCACALCKIACMTSELGLPVGSVALPGQGISFMHAFLVTQEKWLFLPKSGLYIAGTPTPSLQAFQPPLPVLCLQPLSDSRKAAIQPMHGTIRRHRWLLSVFFAILRIVCRGGSALQTTNFRGTDAANLTEIRSSQRQASSPHTKVLHPLRGSSLGCFGVVLRYDECSHFKVCTCIKPAAAGLV